MPSFFKIGVCFWNVEESEHTLRVSVVIVLWTGCHHLTFIIWRGEERKRKRKVEVLFVTAFNPIKMVKPKQQFSDLSCCCFFFLRNVLN